MPGNTKTRKPYRPDQKVRRIRMRQSLLQTYEEHLRLALGWLRTVPAVEHDAPLDSLAHLANVIVGAYPALLDQPAVAGASRTLNDLIGRFVAHGRVVVGAHEAAAIAAGINILIERMATADVMQLHLAAQRIERERAQILAGGVRHEPEASAA